MDNILDKKTMLLVVDDNELNRRISSIYLKSYDITEAINGIEAIEILKVKKVDIILMDINMPIMDGIETAKIIINEMKLKTPIIITSAGYTAKQIELIHNLGIADHLKLPLNLYELKRVLNKYIKL